MEEEKVKKYVEENFMKLLTYLDKRKKYENSVFVEYQKEEEERFNSVRSQIDSLMYSFYGRGLNEKVETDSTLSYQLLLICSYVQSHFLINDLIMNGQYIDSITLIRKQLEILTRLHELDAKPLLKLEKKTPNVINTLGKLGKSLYPFLSKIAHMASTDIEKLLHIVQHGELTGPTPFSEYKKEISRDIFNAHFCISIYFLAWLIKKQEDLLTKDYVEENQLLLTLFQECMDLGIIVVTE
jgi:hypothetical protein